MIETWRADVMPDQPKPSVLGYWLEMTNSWTPKQVIKHCARQCGEYVYLPEHCCPICIAKKERE